MSKNSAGLVEKITTFSKRENGREKILSDVNSRPCHLYNTKTRQDCDVRKKRLFHNARHEES